MVTTKEIALKHTQKGIKGNLSISLPKKKTNQTQKKTVVQEMRDKRALSMHIEKNGKMTELSPSLSIL